MMDEETLSRKATDSLRTTWVVASIPKPANIKLQSTTLLQNGGLLLELDSIKTAQWLKSDGNIGRFLEGIGSGTSAKNRTYQVIISFVPVSFDPTDDGQVRRYEEDNNIPRHSILKAEWIKQANERGKGQRVATLRMYHRDAGSANAILKHSAHGFGKRVETMRPRKDPIRCTRCQKFGHGRPDCKSDNEHCGKCLGTHDTDTCRVLREDSTCVNCLGPHASYDRDCQVFLEERKKIDQLYPENGLAYYPTDEPWTWAMLEPSTPARRPRAWQSHHSQ